MLWILQLHLAYMWVIQLYKKHIQSIRTSHAKVIPPSQGTAKGGFRRG